MRKIKRKLCKYCNIEKSINNFYLRRESRSISNCFYYINKCNDCTQKYRRNKYNTDSGIRERSKKSIKKIHDNDPLYRVKYWLKDRYGLTCEEYDKQLKLQNNLCYICERTYNKRLAIDHCHITGKIRGLLCHCCNNAIGLLKEDKDLLIKAAKYLKNKGIWFENKKVPKRIPKR